MECLIAGAVERRHVLLWRCKCEKVWRVPCGTDQYYCIQQSAKDMEAASTRLYQNDRSHLKSDDLTIPELFHALKQRLCGISSNYISNSSGLALKEVISLQTEASDVLSLVQGLRNLSSPVCRLPGEVLERIFVMRALEQDLLAASRVCRHWRETLISAPHLWTKLQCIGVARTLQYLARSEPVPVHVIGDFDSDIQAVIALKSATDRFGSLTLRLQPFDLLQVFRQLVSPAHALEHLEILAAPHFGDGPTFRPTIPATFLGGSTPALKSFHLNGINTKLNFSEFPALTRLNVVTNVQTFDMSELFQVFTSAKLLEEVSVQSCGPTTPIAESQDVIRLPRVKKLSFSSTVGEFPKRLLSLLVMPSVEEVKLDINLHGEDTGTMRDFLPARLQNFPHLLKVGSLKLDVPQAHCNIQFGGPGGVVSIHALRSGNREQNDGFQTHWLNSLEPMSITDVKDLTLRSYHPEESLDRCPVFKTLKALDGLRSLAVERCNNAILIKALAPTKERSILFPHLEILTFQLTTEPTTVFPGLTDVAQERSRARFPLSKVASDRYSTFRRSDVDALQRHVNCAQLNTIANSRFNEPVNVPAFSIVTDSAVLPKSSAGQTKGKSPRGGLPSPNRGKNPLADLVAMYSRG